MKFFWGACAAMTLAWGSAYADPVHVQARTACGAASYANNQEVPLAVGLDGSPCPPSGAPTSALQSAGNTILSAISSLLSTISSTLTSSNTSLTTIATNTTGVTAVLSASITRPSNTTAYAAGQALCASTSVNCVPMSFTAGRRNGGSGLLLAAQLFKSGTGTTNASYTIEIYQTTPTMTSIHDASTYSPSLADINSGAYRGYASCASPLANGDNVQFQCTLGPATAGGGAIGFVSDGSALIYAVLQVNGAYTPVSGEVFRVVLTEVQD